MSMTLSRSSERRAVGKIMAGGNIFGLPSPISSPRSSSEAMPTNPPHAKLPDREFQVLGLIAHRKTITNIAEELSLSVKSVSTYRAPIVEKRHLQSTADLTRYALEHRLIV